MANIDNIIALLSGLAVFITAYASWRNGRKTKGSLIQEIQEIALNEARARQEMEKNLRALITAQDEKIIALQDENAALRAERDELKSTVKELEEKIRVLESKSTQEAIYNKLHESWDGDERRK